ncbi:hypothetical protein caldi_25700 [Caldinitratiruptor microaerophilus]|uniref:Coat F domain-containing protein n=2 Tax=Caldinitratiruptor microaerophilus TaxID=671077 RepID=A0AA35CPM2_9FIRM|nr:hypothetical protein caldi_25700 [Caldinitratiruptor microaerophilus]
MPDMMSDMAIAMRCSNSLKMEAMQAAMAACESSDPSLRQHFVQACADAIRAQEQVARIMIQRGWYVPAQANGANLQQVQGNLSQWAGMMAGAAMAPGGGAEPRAQI